MSPPLSSPVSRSVVAASPGSTPVAADPDHHTLESDRRGGLLLKPLTGRSDVAREGRFRMRRRAKVGLLLVGLAIATIAPFVTAPPAPGTDVPLYRGLDVGIIPGETQIPAGFNTNQLTTVNQLQPEARIPRIVDDQDLQPIRQGRPCHCEGHRE